MCKAKGVYLRYSQGRIPQVSQGGLPWFWMLQKGGHARSRRRAVIGLYLRLGPIPKEVWMGKIARLCNKALISHGKSSAPLQSVRIVTCYSLFREGTANAAGKELHEVLVNLRRLSGIVFRIKPIF